MAREVIGSNPGAFTPRMAGSETVVPLLSTS